MSYHQIHQVDCDNPGCPSTLVGSDSSEIDLTGWIQLAWYTKPASPDTNTPEGYLEVLAGAGQIKQTTKSACCRPCALALLDTMET